MSFEKESKADRQVKLRVDTDKFIELLKHYIKDFFLNFVLLIKLCGQLGLVLFDLCILCTIMLRDYRVDRKRKILEQQNKN